MRKQERRKLPGGRLLAALMTLATVLVLSACGRSEPIKVGFIAGTSGRVADLGVAGRNGAMLAVELQNAAGGIGGRPVELLTRDDEQNPEVARMVTKDLIDQRVEAIVGPMTSAMAAAIVPLANAAKVVLLSPTVTSTDFSGKDDYFFRVIAETTAYATKSANVEHKVSRSQRLVAIHDIRNRSYTESWLRDFGARYEALGGKILAVHAFESSPDVHFDEMVKKALQDRPDSILLIASSVDAAMLCQQIRRLDSKVALIGSEWASTERLIELGGRAVEGMLVTQFLDRTSREPRYLSFLEAYKKRFGHEPGFAGVAGYDAAQVVLQALGRRKAGQPLKEVFLDGREFTGLQEMIRFDRYGDAPRSTYPTVIRNGVFENLRE